jgi:2-polyprenyl-3-methyl-5-hydroxy-6-metoxy-1,4-benzoquinol methylase
LSDSDSKGGDYRSRIYENYAANFKDAGGVLDEASAAAGAKAYRAYLNGWLPSNRDADVADIACGSGKLLYCFRELGYSSLTGVEISLDQIALARQVLTNVVQQDALTFLEQNPSRFDLVTGIDIVEHFCKSEVLNFLDGCYSSLRPQGRLILQTPNADSPWGMSLRYGDFTHETSFSPDLLSRLMRLSGFQEIEVREMGPLRWGYSATSTIRYFVWRMIHACLRLWNVIETGNSGSSVFTRTFLISGRKP